MPKGHETKESILEKAYDLAAKCGLEGISIAQLAEATQMSKSGLFAHFQSKENLQLALLEWTRESFVREVLQPTIQVKRGISRLQALFSHWRSWQLGPSRSKNGCLYISASAEFASQAGPVRSLVKKTQAELITSIARVVQTAIDQKEFREDTQAEFFAYQMYSLILGYHTYKYLLKDADASDHLERGFQLLVEQHRKER